MNEEMKGLPRAGRSFFAAALLLLLIALPAMSHDGHVAPTPTPNIATSSANLLPSPEPVTDHAAKRVDAFPTLHPLVVHFPIMLLLLAALLQVVSLFLFKLEIGWVVLAMAILGVIGSYLSSNVFHPHTTGLSESAQRLLTEHEWYASLTFWFAVAGTLAKGVSIFFRRPWWGEGAAVTALLAAAVAVSIAGHHGAELVHKEGVGPRGDFLEMHDH